MSSDELNNIDIYKKSRYATVHITSTVLRRGWFMEIIPSRDIGSGFVLDDVGNILTNSHVLQGGGKIQVTMRIRTPMMPTSFFVIAGMIWR